MKLGFIHEDRKEVDLHRAETSSRPRLWGLENSTESPETDIDIRMRPDLPFPLDPARREIFDPESQIEQTLKAFDGQATWSEIWSQIQPYLAKLKKHGIPIKSPNTYKRALNKMIMKKIIRVQPGHGKQPNTLSLSI